jgi:3'(2'), 5'-bisphosphate nucleotidase
MNNRRITGQFSDELETAIKLAHQAGLKIMDFYNTSFVVEEKLGLDNYVEPVTEADRQASEIIVAGLKENFPEDGILSEELIDTSERLALKRAWIIDPIDGTYGFVKREGDFAVQIGLAVEGESVLGVIYEPLAERLFWAVEGEGAWLEPPAHEPQRLRVSEKTRFSDMIVAASRSHYNQRQQRLRKYFGFKKEIRRGSVGVKIGLLTLQECDVYVTFSARTKHWDTCAPQIVLEEAGGKMTDLYGERIRYNTPDVQNYNGVVSTNGAAHGEIITRLKPLLTEFGRVRVKTLKLRK